MILLEVSEKEHKKIQQLELQILEEFDRVCNLHHLQYTIAYGSLLGAVRHGGFIPWDDDIDVCMLREDFEKLRLFGREYLSKPYFYQYHDTDSDYYYLMDKIRLNDTIFKESFVSKYNIHHGIYIDIFPIDKLPQNKIKRCIQYYTFHFFRIGLQSKYLMSAARSGKKKIVAIMLKCLYAPFSLDFLYRKCHKIASWYENDESSKDVACFFSPYKKKDVYKRNMIMNVEKRKFENIIISAVTNYDVMLTQLYGSYMKLPPLKNRETKHTITELKL